MLRCWCCCCTVCSEMNWAAGYTNGESIQLKYPRWPWTKHHKTNFSFAYQPAMKVEFHDKHRGEKRFQWIAVNVLMEMANRINSNTNNNSNSDYDHRSIFLNEPKIRSGVLSRLVWFGNKNWVDFIERRELIDHIDLNLINPFQTNVCINSCGTQSIFFTISGN